MFVRASFVLSLFVTGCLFSSIGAASSGKGHISIGDYGETAPEPDPVSSNEGRLEAEYDRRFRFGSNFVFRLHATGRATSLQDSWEQQAYVDPSDISLSWDKSVFYIRVGTFTPHWEGTDGVNPMDIAAQRDYGDPLSPPTLGSLGVQIGGGGESYDWELEYIPQQTRSFIPGVKSMWLPRHADLPQGSTGGDVVELPNQVDYTFGTRGEVNSALENNVAARLQIRTGWIDFALAGFHGASTAPAIALNNPLITTITSCPPPGTSGCVFQIVSPIPLMAIDYMRDTGAAIFTVPLGQWIFRVSGRYDQPEGTDINIPLWSDEVVGGVERSFDIHGNTWTAILQGVWSHHPETSSLLSLQDLFDQAQLLGLRMPVGDNWTLLLSGFRSGFDGSLMGQAFLDWRVTNYDSLEWSVQSLSGVTGSIFNDLGNPTRVGMKYTRSF